MLRTRTKIEIALGSIFFAGWLLFQVDIAPVRLLIRDGLIVCPPWSKKLLMIVGFIMLAVAIINVARDWRDYQRSM